MKHIQLILKEVIHNLTPQERNMLNDKTVFVNFTNTNNETQVMEMTITGKQLEQTILRRMATLLPTARNIQVYENKPDSHQLELGKGGKK